MMMMVRGEVHPHVGVSSYRWRRRCMRLDAAEQQASTQQATTRHEHAINAVHAGISATLCSNWKTLGAYEERHRSPVCGAFDKGMNEGGKVVTMLVTETSYSVERHDV